jgi:hypothetical protein
MPDRDEVVRCLEPIIGCAKQEKWGAWIDTLEDAVALLKPVPVQTLFITPYRKSGMKHGRCPEADIRWSRTACFGASAAGRRESR